MEEPAGRETLLETADQDVGFFALGGADGIGIPFAGFEVVDGNEGRLAPIVNQTSLLAKSSSIWRPREHNSTQSVSENGLVMRGCSATRVTFMSKSNSTLAKLAIPEIGAALA